MRHAHAGTRFGWSGPDEDRPLTDLGRDEAKSVADQMAQIGITRILSSPYVRCIQSVEPLSRLTGVTVEIETALGEGADPEQTEALLMGSGPDTIACSHGDVISAFLGRAAAEGAALEGGLRFRKASVWHLETGPTGRILSGRYDPPPLTGS
ncbi:MAG: histidine phosphatase family protein [Acidimicrobiia bacterium]|nr:histidine phosphatase family protein [Acidimicrobiia bacterium]